MNQPELRRDMTFDEYRLAPGVNYSKIKLFEFSSVQGEYELAQEREDKWEFRFGRHVHSAALEPESWARTPKVVVPMNPKAYPATFEAQRDKALTKDAPDNAVVMPHEWHEWIPQAAESIRGLPHVAHLIDVGQAESSAFWTDPTLDMRCKARLDFVRVHNGRAVIADIKTASDITPDGCRRNAKKFLYHWQAAWYIRAAYHAFPEIEAVDQFQFWVVQNKPPFEARVYVAKPYVIEYGWLKMLEAIERYKDWRTTSIAKPSTDKASWLEMWIDDQNAIPNPPLHPRQEQ